jgi:hypothetical protein
MEIEQTQEDIKAVEKPNDSEINFANLRKKAEKLEKEAQFEREQRIRLESTLEMMRSQPAPQKKEPVEEEEEDDGEPYVVKKALDRKLTQHTNRLMKEIERKAEEKAMQLFEKQKQQNYLNEHRDFNEVLNPENLQYLVDNHPEVANSILEMPEGFARQKLAYQTLKAFKQKEEKRASIQETINNNHKSLYYQPSQYGNPPSATTMDFTPQGRKQAYDAMKKMMAGMGG